MIKEKSQSYLTVKGNRQALRMQFIQAEFPEILYEQPIPYVKLYKPKSKTYTIYLPNRDETHFAALWGTEHFPEI